MKVCSSQPRHAAENSEQQADLKQLTTPGRRDFLKCALVFTVALVAPHASAADPSSSHLILGDRLEKKRKNSIEVTDFNDYAPGREQPGSLRHALLTASPDTKITFARPGTIELIRPLHVAVDGITISGQKNPVVLIGDTVMLRASDVELRHLWIFAGDAPVGARMPGKESHSKGGERDALVVLGSDKVGAAAIHSISIEHCWIGFGIDECFSTYGAVQQVVVNRCIVGFGLNRSIHPKDKDRLDAPGHGKGALIGVNSKNITFTENLFLHNFDRNVAVRGGTENITFIGNTIYNWGRGNAFVAGDSGAGGKTSSGIFRDNTYIMGKNSLPGTAIFKPLGPETAKQYQVSGNRGPIPPTEPFPSVGSTTDAAGTAFAHVMKLAGPHPGLNDRLSRLALSQLQERTGEVIDFLTEKQNGEARVGLGFRPTLEALASDAQLKQYLDRPEGTR